MLCHGKLAIALSVDPSWVAGGVVCVHPHKDRFRTDILRTLHGTRRSKVPQGLSSLFSSQKPPQVVE